MRHPLIARMQPLVVLTLVTVGCASTATPTPRAETTYIPGASGAMTVTAGTAPFVQRIAAPLEQVWRAVPAAYDSLSIPLTLIDPKLHALGNEGFKVRQKLGTTRMSTYIECGATQVGPNADSYEIYLTVITQVEAEGPSSSKVTTTITAAAKPMQYAQEYSRCSTKDVLEARIRDVIAAGVKK